MKILQKLPIWVVLLIVSLGGIVVTVDTSAEQVRQMTFSMETVAGSAEVLQNISLELQLYDNPMIYWNSISGNKTNIWNNDIWLYQPEECVTEYSYDVRQKEDYISFEISGGDAIDFLQLIESQTTIGSKGGTYALKDYTSEIPMTIRYTIINQGIGRRLTHKVDATTFPIHIPVTDEMFLIVGEEGNRYGNVMESQRIECQGVPYIFKTMKAIEVHERIFVTIPSDTFAEGMAQGVSGIIEIKENGKMQVVYSIPYGSDAAEQIIGMEAIGEDGLVLLTQKENQLLAYYYDISNGIIEQPLVLSNRLLQEADILRVVLEKQDQLLLIKLQYQAKGKENYAEMQYFYGALTREHGQLISLLASDPIVPIAGEPQILHSYWLTKSYQKESLYYYDGILYEVYDIKYLVDPKGEILFLINGEEISKEAVVVCAFDKEKMIYYGKLHGTYEEQLARDYHMTIGDSVWNVGTLRLIERKE